MSDSNFNRRIDETLRAIEEAVDASGTDIDYERQGDVLTLTFEDDSQVIINSQSAARQLWLAARSGGYHFDWNEQAGTWLRDSDGSELFEVLTRVAGEHAGSPVELRQA